MLYQIQGNQVTLYHAIFNKNRLKAIRKKVIAKYGKDIDQIRMSYKDFMQLWFPGEEEPQDKFTVAQLQKISIYSGKISVGTNCTFQIISQPDLAIIIDEILHGNEDMIESLIPYYEYFHAKSENSFEKLDEFYDQYGIFLDLDGYIYIEEILKNLKLIPVYQDTFTDEFDLNYKWSNCDNHLTNIEASSIKKILISEDVPYKMTSKVKKFGSIL